MYKKLNYATGVLSAGISDSATEVVLKAGHTITTETGEANKFVGVFFDKAKSSPFQDVNREIVEAYRTDTNKFTIARAKEGTSAKSWVEDDNFMLIASSAVFDEYEAELNNKQDALGFTPENITNKKTTITDSDTDYPTGRAVKTALDGKEPILTKGSLSGSGVITIDNTRQVIGGAATISHTDSATVRHVTDTEKATWNAKQNALGYTPENVANKRTSFQATPTDTAYISEKLAKDSLDLKLNISSKAVSSEINTGTDNDKYITPDALAGSNAFTKTVQQICVDFATELAVAEGVGYIVIPAECNGMNLISARADVITAGTTNASTFDIYNVTDSTSMLSSAISIASGAKSGTGTVNTDHDDVATGDIIRIDVDTLSTTKPKGLIVTLAFRLP